MVEYARSRLRFVWANAARLPNVTVTAATTPTASPSDPGTSHGEFHAASWTVSSTRSVSATAAAFDATDRNPATSAAAPSNTSGHQKWNGTAASLNPNPTSTQITPATTGIGIPAPPAPNARAISGNDPVPYAPQTRLIPYSITPAALAP